MVVYPLKWVPYLFIIGGILAILIGEGDVAWNLCVIGIGVAWLVIKKKYFDKPAQSNTSNVNYTQTSTNYMNAGAGEKPVNNFCTSCGAKLQSGDKFCMNCGKKLN